MEGADLAQGKKLRKDERLKDFILEGVEPTGVTISNESYGSVVEVKYSGAPCVAKEVLVCNTSAAVPKFLEECRLLAKLRHPKIVQFFGICFLPSVPVPMLVMERLRTSLSGVLEAAPAAGIPLAMKCSILRDVASGLAFLHSRTPSIVHRDVTAKNVLLNDGMEAKLANFEMSRLLNLTDATSAQSLLYMPPEASTNTTIDVFSYGILALFTLTQVFPKNVLPASYTDQETQTLVTRSEAERRQEYIEKLHQVPGISNKHYLVGMVEHCLENDPHKRPSIQEILQELEQSNDAESVRQDKLLLLLRHIDRSQHHVNNLKSQQIWQTRTYYYNYVTEEVWSLHTTGDGRMFYHNIVTEETLWKLPATDATSSLGPSKGEAGKYEPIPVLFHEQHIRAVKDARKSKRRQTKREKRPSVTEVENISPDSPRETEMPELPHFSPDKQSPLASSPKEMETEIPQLHHVEHNPLEHTQKIWQEYTYFYNHNTKEVWTKHATGDGRIFYCNIVTNQISWVLPGTDAASTSGPTKEEAGKVEPIPVLIHVKNLKDEKLKRRQSRRVKSSKSISLSNTEAENSVAGSPNTSDKPQSPYSHTYHEEKKENISDLPTESNEPQSMHTLANHEEKENSFANPPGEADKPQSEPTPVGHETKVQPLSPVPPTPPPRKFKEKNDAELPKETDEPHVLANHKEKEKSFADSSKETVNPQSEPILVNHENKVQPQSPVPPTPPPRKFKEKNNPESPKETDKPESHHIAENHEVKVASLADSPKEQKSDTPADSDEKVQPQSPVPPTPLPRKFKNEGQKPPIPHTRKESLPENVSRVMEDGSRPEE